MAIAAVSGQNGGANNAAATETYAFASNVAANSLIVIMAMQTEGANDAFIAADCTKSAGTATIGTVQLDINANGIFAGSTYMRTGIWSCLVTASGSLTMQVSNGSTVFFHSVQGHEFSGDWDSTRLEDSISATTGTSNTNIVTGNASSVGIGLFVGVGGTTEGTVPTITPDAAFTEIDEQTGANPVTNSMYRISTGALTDSGDWTLGANTGWSGSLAVYKESAGGGGSSILISSHYNSRFVGGLS